MSLTVMPTESTAVTRSAESLAAACASCPQRVHTAHSRLAPNHLLSGDMSQLRDGAWGLGFRGELSGDEISDTQPPRIDRERWIHPTRSGQHAAVDDIEPPQSMRTTLGIHD